MKTVDVKGVIIGVLLAALVGVGIAATTTTTVPTTDMLTPGRYNVNITNAGGLIYFCFSDTETGQCCLGQYAPNAAHKGALALTIIGTFENPLLKTEIAPQEQGAPTGPFGK